MNSLTSLLIGGSISVAGMMANNPQLTYVGNMGVFGCAFAQMSQDKKERQQRDSQYQTIIAKLEGKVSTLHDIVIKNADKEQFNSVSLQNSLSTLIQEYKQNAENIDDLREIVQQTDNNLRQQNQEIEVCKLNNQQLYCEVKAELHTSQEKNDRNFFEIERLQFDVHQVDTKFTEQGQQLVDLQSQQQQQEREISRSKLQAKTHSKKLLKLQSRSNSQQANQNRNLSRIQKLENIQKLSEKESQKPIFQKVIRDKAITEAAKNKVKSPVLKNFVAPRKLHNYCYIDNNNLYKCLQKEGIKIDYEALWTLLNKDVSKEVKLYDGAFPNQAYKYKKLRKIGYQTKTLPIVFRDNDKPKTVGDDVQLAIDLVRDVKPGDFVTIVSGDGDLFPAVKRVKEKMDVRVTVIAKSTAVSKNLLVYADEFTPLESIMQDIAQDTKFSA